jgi:hypothetical protein
LHIGTGSDMPSTRHTRHNSELLAFFILELQAHIIAASSVSMLSLVLKPMQYPVTLALPSFFTWLSTSYL